MVFAEVGAQTTRGFTEIRNTLIEILRYSCNYYLQNLIKDFGFELSIYLLPYIHLVFTKHIINRKQKSVQSNLS